MRHGLVDHDRSTRRFSVESVQDSERLPGLVVLGIAALGFLTCVTNFAFGHAGAGVTAAIVALLAFGAGLSWLGMDRRRIREAERARVTSRPKR